MIKYVVLYFICGFIYLAIGSITITMKLIKKYPEREELWSYVTVTEWFFDGHPIISCVVRLAIWPYIFTRTFIDLNNL